jgi:hypothetical protein
MSSHDALIASAGIENGRATSYLPPFVTPRDEPNIRFSIMIVKELTQPT